jgi:putative ABC transport system permease protein
MFDLDKWEEIALTMMKHKLRTVLTCFGVFWGIFMLVILLGAGAGLHNGALQNFDIAKNSVFVWTRETAVPFAGFEAGRTIRLTNSDHQALSELREVGTVASRLQVSDNFGDRVLTIERGAESVSFTVMGDYPEFLAIKPYVIEAGRFINRLDMDQRRKVVVIGTRVRDELFAPGEQSVGDYVRLGGVPFKVVGIFSTRTTGEEALRDLQTTHVPLTTAQQTFNLANQIDWLGFVPADGVTADAMEETVKDVLRKRHKIAPDDRQALASFNVEKEFRQMQGVFTGIGVFSWFVAIGTIIAGMVGVANIMLIIVKERTREIGIRKSVGATPGAIIGMIVLEASVISAAAGYLGLLCGVLLIELVRLGMLQLGLQSEFFANPEIDFRAAVAAIGVLLMSGVLAGLFPGLKAARVNPVIALRDE